MCQTNFELKDYGFFGVFDGHAGPKVSQYCSQQLLECILECLHQQRSKDVTENHVKKAINDGFLHLDEKLKKEPQWANGEDRSGTTAIVVMVSPQKIIWGNCGDSRGILCRNGKVVFSTQDHKPYNQTERERIEKAGGTVMMQRVNGSLAVSRALGDFDYKRGSDLKPSEQLVSPVPEITVYDRDPSSDEFLLLACDGIFDVMSNEDVVGYVSHRLTLTDDLAQVCSDLIDTCLNKVPMLSVWWVCTCVWFPLKPLKQCRWVEIINIIFPINAHRVVVTISLCLNSCFQNSRDNMSVVLVTFPGAPKVSQEAIQEVSSAFHPTTSLSMWSDTMDNMESSTLTLIIT